MPKTYLSLGSNLGDRLHHLQQALAQLEARAIHILRVSKIYETEPVGYLDQPDFLNLAAEAETTLTPHQLLAAIHEIEHSLKRERSIPNGPRTIDIDIILFGDLSVRTPDLEIPHPRYRERAFVLAPLSDLIPVTLPFEPPRVYSKSIASSSPSPDSATP